ncbi:MAG: DUF6172 family protein [Xylophilus ampelinus]
MRKTFPLDIEGRHRDRVVEAAKHDIRKYVQRERRKALPAGADFWAFDCRFGTDREAAHPIEFAAITAHVDEAARAGAPAFYLEILARPAQRGPRPERAPDGAGGDASAAGTDGDAEDAAGGPRRG